MVDHSPNGETVLSQPTACPKCGALPSDACAKTGGWCEDVSRRLVVHIGQPAAPISPQEIAEMRARVNAATPGPWLPSGHGFQVLTGDSWNSICEFHVDAQWEDGRGAATHQANAFFVGRARSDMPRLLDAIETLTAERDGAVAAGNAETSRLLVMIRDQAAEIDRLTSERDTLRDAVAEGGSIIEALRAEVERLKAMLPPEPTDDRPLSEVFADLRAIVAEADMQELADFGQRYQPETCATAGIDMALLGKLCSEEPDADTKREVAEVMATVRATDAYGGSEYRKLARMAREDIKDGD